jgi:DNA-binding transcriptional LysR family regulator
MALNTIMSEANDVSPLDLNLLQVFDALLRERSVTRAGISLGLSQSAVSHALTRLRSFFDDPLFIKAHRGVTLSPKAEALAADVTRIMEAIRSDVLAQAKFEPATLKRTFSLALSDMGELVIMPSLLRALSVVAPQCKLHTVQIPPEHLETSLANGEADLAVHSMAPVSDLLYQQTLINHNFVSIVGAQNTTLGGVMTREQFEAMPHVVVMLSGRGRPPYDVALDDVGVKRRVVMSTPHFLFVPMLLARNPELVATVPKILGRTFEDHGLVRTYQIPVELPSFPLRQYWHPRFHHDLANKWLRTMVREALQDFPPDHL